MSGSTGIPRSRAASVTPPTPSEPAGRSEPQRRKSDPNPLPHRTFDIAGAKPEAVPSQLRPNGPAGNGPAAEAAAPPDEAQAAQALETAQKAEAKQRAANLPAEVAWKDASEQPPARKLVLPGQVRQVLGEMLGDKASRFMPPAQKQRAHDYHEVGPHDELGEYGKLTEDPRFRSAVELDASGREQLASYYARKWGVDIQFHPGLSSKTAAGMAEQIVRMGRAVGQDGPHRPVRCAHYFGHDSKHASLVVYIREGDGREALMFFDSAGGQGRTGARLTQACANLARDGGAMPVYEHLWGLQHDDHSCWVYAMKAAVALTGRRRDAQTREFGDFLRPDLLNALHTRRIKTPAPSGPIQIWALPELARMGQTLKTIGAQAGPDWNETLVSVKRSETLIAFLKRYTFATEASGGTRPDYMRQKGDRLAEILDILQWSERIAAHVGKDQWTPERQDQFIAKMKVLVRAGAYQPTTENDIELLDAAVQKSALWTSAEAHAFFDKAGDIRRRLVAEMRELPEPRSIGALVGELPPAGFEALCDQIETTIANITRFGDIMFKAGVSGRVVSDAEVRVLERLRAQVDEERVLRDILGKRPDKAAVAEMIGTLPQASLAAFTARARELVQALDKTRIQLGDGASDDDLKAFAEDLFAQGKLIERLERKFARIAARAASGSSDSDDSDDSEDFDDDDPSVQLKGDIAELKASLASAWTAFESELKRRLAAERAAPAD